jgi:AcrR family transcriptional regulator
VTPTDQVQTRPGGRNAQVRARVIDAVRQALESGDPQNLSFDRLAGSAGVHRATIYRRWLSTEGLVADLLAELTPLNTPLPDTGDLRGDLAEVAARVAATTATPTARMMQRLVAGTTDPHLAAAARAYWSSLLDHTAEIIRRAQRRDTATTEVDPVAATESLLAPIHFRLLITQQPTTAEFLTEHVDHMIRLLRP